MRLSAKALFLHGLIIPGLTLLAPTVARPESEFASTPYQIVAQKLLAKGATPKFVEKLLKTADPAIRDRILELNTTGFRKRGDYSAHLSPGAVEKSLAFSRKFRRELSKAESAYKVPSEVITALIWVETKFGKHTGSYDVTSVFMNIATADSADGLAISQQFLERDIPPGHPEHDALVEKLKTVSTSKAEWAADQLLALDALQREGKLNPFRLKGSFAGAFGAPQFIPSSYSKWARSTDKKRPADLSRMPDAIQSVAHYLHIHGWSETPESQSGALYAYNRSQTYGRTILELARQMKVSRELARSAH